MENGHGAGTARRARKRKRWTCRVQEFNDPVTGRRLEFDWERGKDGVARAIIRVYDRSRSKKTTWRFLQDGWMSSRTIVENIR